MPSPICVKCQCELRPETNGTTVVELAGERPYKVWDADTWKCPGCGTEIVTGFGQNPILQAHESDFRDRYDSYITAAKRIVFDYEQPQKGDHF